MKFTCDKCGKRFASVDEPLPGRVYRIRCGRCAHLIAVQAPVPWEDPAADLHPALPAASTEGTPEEKPWLELPRAVAPAPGGAPLGEGSQEVSIDLALSDEYPLQRRRRARRDATALFVLSGTAALVLTVLVVLLTRGAGRGPARDPAGAPGTAAPPRSSTAEVAPPAPARDPPPAPASAAERPAPAPPPAALAVRPAPPRRPAPAPVKEAARPAAAPQRARPPRATVAFEREPPAPPPDASAPAAMDPGLAAALHAKDDVPVQAVPADVTELRAILEGRRAVLDACFDGAAGTGGAAAWAGRTPQLVVRIDPSGRAAGRVDDGALEPTAIASCLRRTVSRLTFPSFGGDPVELAMPVGLPAN